MNFIERIKRIILAPRKEWPVIEKEALSLGDLYLRYALPLILASSLAKLVGLFFFGFPLNSLRWGSPTSLSGILLFSQTLAQLLNLFLMALTAYFLSPRLGGKADFLGANKLIIFSSTPGWLGGLLGIFPPLGIFGELLGLYGLYLFYLGAPVILKIPERRSGLFLALCGMILLVLFVFMALLTIPLHPWRW